MGLVVGAVVGALVGAKVGASEGSEVPVVGVLEGGALGAAPILSKKTIINTTMGRRSRLLTFLQLTFISYSTSVSY